jgi:tetratricopeptide (TPR) repeat protein
MDDHNRTDGVQCCVVLIVPVCVPVAIRLKTLPDHPDTAATYNNMALVYDNQGEYTQALAFYDKSLAISLKTLGPEHPDTAETYYNMGALCYNMKDFKQSVKHLELALAIMLKSFDPEHPRISDIKSSIAAVMKKM